MISVKRLILTVLLAALMATPAVGAASAVSDGSMRLATELPNLVGQPQLESELERLRSLGFESFWLHTHQLYEDPLGETIRPNETLERLVRWQREANHGAPVRWLLSIRPHQAHDGDLAISDKEMVRRIVRLAKRWRDEIGGNGLVLSFAGYPQRNREIRDLLTYGKEADVAQLDLVRRVAAKLPRSLQLFYEPSDLTTDSLLKLAPQLPRRVGLLWSGPSTPSAEIRERDTVALRKAMGDRPVVLRDLFPANQSAARLPLSINLGPLSGRDASLRDWLSMHLSVPMDSWAASRLSLATVADWARQGAGYDPKTSQARALERLAGDDKAALDALKTQTLEWGGPLLGRNWHTAERDSPAAIAALLQDPARLASWRYVLTRYPGRMEALRRVQDAPFRDALLELMGRRLAIARALVPVQELRARQAAGRSDLAPLIEELERLRRFATPLSARVALDRFLIAAGVGPLLRNSEGED